MEFKIPPYEWQHRLMDMSNVHPHLAIFADMGTGKTGGTINVIRLRYAQYGGLVKTLIVSPLVTLYNWRDEFLKHSNVPASKIHVLRGTTTKKLQAAMKAVEHNPCQILIVNYEAFISPKFKEFIQAWEPTIGVLDESHNCKNPTAKRSKSIEQVVARCKNRYILTGTPIANKLTDLYMQFKILDGGATFGTNYYAFQRTYMRDENWRWAHMQKHFPKWVPIEEKLPELNKKIYAKGIRVMKSECLDLPPYIHEVYKVELSDSQRKYYNLMRDDFLAYVEEAGKKGHVVASTAMTKALRLQQIVTGYVKLDDGSEVEIEDCPRLDALEELIDALHVEHKVIVWCSFTHNYKTIGRMLDKNKIKYVQITGEESLDEKDANMRSFNHDPEIRVAVCNRRAAGIGINLVQSDYSIVFSRNFSLTEELQSTDRNYRGGSEIHEKITRIDLCAEDTIDEDVTLNLKDKKDVANSIVGFIQQRGK